MQAFTPRASRLWIVAAITVLLLAPTASASAGTAGTMPHVDVVVIAEVNDAIGWLTLHQDVLTTAAGSNKMLRVTLPSRTGGGRSIDIEHPRFTVGLVATGGKPLVKVTMAGKVPPALALTLVTPFQQAAMEIQAGVVPNEIGLAYGLSTAVGRLLEVYFDRP